MNIFVMVGLPGSGKSYTAKKLFDEIKNNNEEVVYLSSDSYRENLLGNENDQSNNVLIFNTLYSDLRDYIRERKENIILDMTNTTLKSRKKIFDNIRMVNPNMENIKVVAYVIAPPLSVCVCQDAERERTVGKEIIHKFLASFQFPQKFEGFNEIWLNEYRENKMFEYNEVEFGRIASQMKVFDQKNPHHKYSLGEHCFNLAAQYFNQLSFEDLMTEKYDIEICAGQIHDIGKLFTQKIDENGIAHYYNHDSIGTYYIVSHPEIVCTDNWDNFFEIIFYVNYHMRAHRDFKSPKAEKKYRSIFGDDRYERLMQFGEFDRIASGTYNKNE